MNRQRSPVTYRRLELPKTLSEGLLAVPRSGGELQEKVASAMFRLAGVAGARADEQAARDGARAGALAGLDGAPQPGEMPPPPLGGPSQSTDLPDVDDGDIGVWLAAQLQKDFGINGAQAAGVAANAHWESGGFKQLQEVNPVVAGSRGGFGWMQWTASRRKEFEAWSAQNKLSPSSPEANYGFLKHELQNTAEGGVLKKLRTASTAEEAALVFSREFLRPGIPHEEKRVALASSYARKINAQSPPVSSSSAPTVPLELQAPGVTPSTGAAGTFRPTGRNTVYGRAFDAAGTQTYLQMLDVTMRQDVANVYAQFKDDPGALGNGLDALLTVHLDGKQGHVFPEIEADYRVAFSKARASYEMEAQRALEKRREAQTQAAFIADTNDLNTVLEQQLATFSPDNPAAAQEILGAQSSVDAHFDSAARRNLMSPEAAEKAKIDGRRTVALKYYARQAENLSAEEIGDFRASMAADFADGGIPSLDGEGWAELDADLKRMERAKGAETRQASAAYQRRANDMVSRVSRGYDIGADELSQFELDAGTTPEGDEIRDLALRTIGTARQIRDLSLPEGDALVRQIERDMGKTPSSEQIEHLDYAQKALAQKRAALNTDLIGYGENAGIVPPGANLADVDTPQDLSDLVAGRVMAGQLLGDHYGVVPQFLRPGEAAALRAKIEADPEMGASISAAIVAGAGEDAAAVLNEFGDAAPQIAHAGAILAFGGNAQAAQDVLEGYAKSDNGKRPAGIRQVLRRKMDVDVIGGALDVAPQERGRIAAAADAISRARMMRMGVDPSDAEQVDDIYARALQEAAGATFSGGVQFGGFADVSVGGFAGFGDTASKVLVPPQMRADLFDEVLESITGDDLLALGAKALGDTDYTVRDIRRARPIAVDGGYVFAQGDPASSNPRYLRGADGGVFKIDFIDARPLFEARVPGAYR